MSKHQNLAQFHAASLAGRDTRRVAAVCEETERLRATVESKRDCVQPRGGPDRPGGTRLARIACDTSPSPRSRHRRRKGPRQSSTAISFRRRGARHLSKICRLDVCGHRRRSCERRKKRGVRVNGRVVAPSQSLVRDMRAVLFARVAFFATLFGCLAITSRLVRFVEPPTLP